MKCNQDAKSTATKHLQKQTQNQVQPSHLVATTRKVFTKPML